METAVITPTIIPRDGMFQKKIHYINKVLGINLLPLQFQKQNNIINNYG